MARTPWHLFARAVRESAVARVRRFQQATRRVDHLLPGGVRAAMECVRCSASQGRIHQGGVCKSLGAAGQAMHHRHLAPRGGTVAARRAAANKCRARKVMSRKPRFSSFRILLMIRIVKRGCHGQEASSIKFDGPDGVRLRLQRDGGDHRTPAGQLRRRSSTC